MFTLHLHLKQDYFINPYIWQGTFITLYCSLQTNFISIYNSMKGFGHIYNHLVLEERFQGLPSPFEFSCAYYIHVSIRHIYKVLSPKFFSPQTSPLKNHLILMKKSSKNCLKTTRMLTYSPCMDMHYLLLLKFLKKTSLGNESKAVCMETLYKYSTIA